MEELLLLINDCGCCWFANLNLFDTELAVVEVDNDGLIVIVIGEVFKELLVVVVVVKDDDPLTSDILFPETVFDFICFGNRFKSMLETAAAATAAAAAWEPPDEAATAMAAAASSSDILLIDNIDIWPDDFGVLFRSEETLSEENFRMFKLFDLLILCAEGEDTGEVIVEVPMVELDFFNFGSVVNELDWEIIFDKPELENETKDIVLGIGVGEARSRWEVLPELRLSNTEKEESENVRN